MPTAKERRTRILTAIAVGKTRAFEVAEYTGLKESYCRTALGRLTEAGEIRRTRVGNYEPIPGKSYPIDVKPVITVGDWPLVRL